MSDRLTVSEMANRLGKSKWTINQWARTGRIPARKHGRDWTFDPDLVEKCLSAKSNATEREMTRR